MFFSKGSQRFILVCILEWGGGRVVKYVDCGGAQTKSKFNGAPGEL